MCTRGYIHIHWLYLPSFCPHFKHISAKSKGLLTNCIEKSGQQNQHVPNKHVEGENSIPSNKHVAPNKCGGKEIFSKK